MDKRIFGYGSLVNCKTHNYENLRRLTAKGWCREWVATPSRTYAYLSLSPDPDFEVDGIEFRVLKADWADLLEREKGYTLLPLYPSTQSAPSPLTFSCSHLNNESPGHSILASYLMTVFAGYKEVFGEHSIERFIASTKNWMPIYNDFSEPLYKRFTRPLSHDEAAIKIQIENLMHLYGTTHNCAQN